MPHKQLTDIINNSKKIVFFGGAGVSTESNIPDFRSENGLYSAKKTYGRTPEELLSRDCFTREPELFFRYYKENLVYPDAKPNAAHTALAEMEAKGRLFAVITQNVDGLHQAAGSRNVIELHGTSHRHYCVKCAAEYPPEYIFENSASYVPKCTCGGIVRPDVVLYGEGLDQRVVANAVSAIENADCLIVGGTSLVVYPAAGLIQCFNGKFLVLINKSSTSYDSTADLIINDSIGKVFGALEILEI